jgi:hypothetical protein
MDKNFVIVNTFREDEKSKVSLPAKVITYKGESLALFVGDNLDERVENYLKVYGHLAEWRYRNIVANYVKRSFKHMLALDANWDNTVTKTSKVDIAVGCVLTENNTYKGTYQVIIDNNVFALRKTYGCFHDERSAIAGAKYSAELEFRQGNFYK